MKFFFKILNLLLIIILIYCSKINTNKYLNAKITHLNNFDQSILLLESTELFLELDDIKHSDICEGLKVYNILESKYLTYNINNKYIGKTMLKVACPNIGWIKYDKGFAVIGKRELLEKDLDKWILITNFKKNNSSYYSFGYFSLTINEDSNFLLEIINEAEEKIVSETFTSIKKINENTFELSNKDSIIICKFDDFLYISIVLDHKNKLNKLNGRKFKLK